MKRILAIAMVALIAGTFAVAALYLPPEEGVPIIVVEIPPAGKLNAQGDGTNRAANLPMREGLKPEDKALSTEPAQALPKTAKLEPAQPIDPRDVTVTAPGEMSETPIDITNSPVKKGRYVRLAKAPMKGFTEASEFGALPRISSSGRKPADVYARPSEKEDTRQAPVRIGIMINGMGISSTGTSEAIVRLPGEITLGFAPYGQGLQSWVNRARSGGHEVMLQIPMEPFDYPDNDPGPHTLLTSLQPPENLNRLRWLMSRFGGYFGITNYMGAKFTSDDLALVPVVNELSARGLSFLDDGASPRSRITSVAGSGALEAGRADLIIDASQSRAGIELALRRLETIAKERGSAIGVGTALPVTVHTVEEWARSLASRGIALTPVSALINPAKI